MTEKDTKRFGELWRDLTTSTAPHREATDSEARKRVMRTYFNGLMRFDYQDVESAAIDIVNSDAKGFFPTLPAWIDRCKSISRRDHTPPPVADEGVEPDADRSERIRVARRAFWDTVVRKFPEQKDRADRICAGPVRVPRTEPCARCHGTGIAVRAGRTERGRMADRVAYRCECSSGQRAA